MNVYRRTIHPEIRIEDEKKAICTYIASNQTVDSYNEVIMADGWRFSQFAKNAPFVDSHDYSTIGKLVGRVIDFKVKGDSLYETVQWAADVEDNELARFGWNMTKGGYLKAVSVGFYPTRAVSKWDSDTSGYRAALKELAITDPSEAPNVIYLEQEQIELSSCIIGANPDALANARSAGILNDTHLEMFPDLRRVLLSNARRRSFSFPTRKPQNQGITMSKQTFLAAFKSKTGNNEPIAAPDFDTESQPISMRAMSSQNSTARSLSLAAADILRDQEKAKWWNEFARWNVKSTKKGPKFRGLDLTPSGFSTGVLLPPGILDDVWDLLFTYGAFATLGVRPAASQYTKLAKVTALPFTQWITPTQGSLAVAEDTNFAGSSIIEPMNVLASLLPVYRGLVEDSAVDLGALLLQKFTEALKSSIDYVCFQGNGVADVANGGQIGIFNDPNIPTVNALAGGVGVQNLTRDDFDNVLSAVTAAVFQRDPRWWIHPSFLPLLAKVRAGTGDSYALRGPGHTGNGWYLADFPVTWTAQAPSINQPGVKIAAFGDGNAYDVSLRQEVAMDATEHSPGAWNKFQVQYLASMRAMCQTREATGLATLALAAK